MQEALSFDDILLTPRYSNILPSAVNPEGKFSRQINLKLPIISSPMDTVTEHQMAITMALHGGLGIIHKNLTPEKQALEVGLVKRFENGFIQEPVTLSPDNTVEDLHQINQKKGYKKIPIVNEQNKLLGLVTELDYFWPEDAHKKIKDIMIPVKKLQLIKHTASLSQANKIIKEKRLNVLCVVNQQGKLSSIVTRKDLEKNQNYPLATKDSHKRLRVGAALGISDDLMERAKLLVKSGVDVFVLDSAHGHSKGIIEALKKLKRNSLTKPYDVVVGNVATAQAVKDLIKAGADGIKVGIGPGSICTTRVVAGIGVPQVTAISEALKGKKKSKIALIADGGIKYSGDITKALALGADSVMIGSLLAGTEETPGETFLVNGQMYKSYRGMGSLGAMKKGSKDRYGQSNVKKSGKFVPEGIEGRIIYRGPAEKTLYQLLGGLKSGMGYLGAKTIKQLQKQARPIKITLAGKKESHPHNVTITKNAPNYSSDNFDF